MFDSHKILKVCASLVTPDLITVCKQLNRNVKGPYKNPCPHLPGLTRQANVPNILGSVTIWDKTE